MVASSFKSVTHFESLCPLASVACRADIPYRFLLFSDVLVYGSEVSSGPSPAWQHHRTLALATMQVTTEEAEQEDDKASRT
jgi:hypothetical protein